MDTQEPQNELSASGDSQKNEHKVKDAIAEAERIKELRSRLYARGSAPAGLQRHAIPQHTVPTQREPVIPAQVSSSVPQRMSVEPTEPIRDDVSYTDTPMKKKRSYRKIFALAGVVFFAGAVAVASLLMFSGNNTISGENISVNVAGQIAIGGGEELPFQIAIANQNAVAIQSATLIIEYPRGTQNSVDGKDLTVERRSLDTIGAGELINVEMKARVFGEENDEKEIKVSIEYRIAGSNATFRKDAEPYRFKISTSPVVATWNTLKTTTSGQEQVLALTIQSNSTASLTDILVRASYPSGFDFSESDPDTISGEDVWKINELKPGEKKVITIKGVVTGYDNDVRKFNATIGVAESSQKNTIGSILAQTDTEITIERPFLDTKITVNGKSGDTIVVDKNDVVIVKIDFENTLNTTIYDGKISVGIQGNALSELDVDTTGGFYDSTKNTLTWDSVDNKMLKEILPGYKDSVSFTLNPSQSVESAPTITFDITVQGQRIFENDVPQQLVGNTKQVIKIESAVTIDASALYSSGPFKNTGPTPPVAEKSTTYSLHFEVAAGNNELAKTEMTARLPQYVKWLNETSGDGSVTYNENTRTIKWIIGSLGIGEKQDVFAQVSLTPSLSQVNATPQIVSNIELIATDKYTGTKVSDHFNLISTSLIMESNKKYRDGRVRETE